MPALRATLMQRRARLELDNPGNRLLDAARVARDEHRISVVPTTPQARVARGELGIADQRIGEYHDFGGIPEELNQGAFEFGPDCAKILRRRARAAIEGAK